MWELITIYLDVWYAKSYAFLPYISDKSRNDPAI